MFGAGDDDDFFTPSTTSASHLASLFGVGGAPPATPESNPSLVYTAPKQPKHPEAEPTKTRPKLQSKLICAKTVVIYKLSDSDCISIGKHVIAIIGDTEKKYLIIYKTKENILSSTKLVASFTYFHVNNLTSSFCDDHQRQFNVHFEEAKDHSDFLKELQLIGVTIKNKEERMETAKSDGTLSDGSQARAHILERISKVGQSMLPAAKNPDLSESEPEEIIKMKKIVRKPKRHSTSEKEMANQSDVMEAASQQFMLPVSASPIQQQYSLVNGQYVPNQLISLQGQMMSLNDPLAIHFAENRTHNSEIRMNLSQLSNKLDSIFSEITNVRSIPPAIPLEQSHLQNKIQELERKLSSLNVKDEEKIKNLTGNIDELNLQIEKLQDTNSTLQTTIEQCNEQIEQQNDIINDLQAINNEFRETIQVENVELENLKSIKGEHENYKTIITDLNVELTDLQATIEKQNDKINTYKKNEEELRKTLEELQGKINNQNLKLKDFEEHFNATKPPDKLTRAKMNEDKSKSFAEQVKHSMNTMYQNILERCPDDGGTFRKLLTQNMKNTTFQIIQEYMDSLSEKECDGEEDRHGAPPPVPEFEVTV